MFGVADRFEADGVALSTAAGRSRHGCSGTRHCYSGQGCGARLRVGIYRVNLRRQGAGPHLVRCALSKASQVWTFEFLMVAGAFLYTVDGKRPTKGSS